VKFCPQCSVHILYGGWTTLIFLIWQNLLWRRLEVPFSSYVICNAKDTWTQADTGMKHHACQLAFGSTIRHNLGPQYSINKGCHHKILGTRKVKWSKFQYSDSQILCSTIPNFITRQLGTQICASLSTVKSSWKFNKSEKLGTLNLHHMKCKMPNRITHSV